jgi:apolipoprotein D and lipocalin family protein
VIALDRADYRYAMVTGPSRYYLWVLARERTLDSALLNELIAKAQAWGFETANLIYVEHDR